MRATATRAGKISSTAILLGTFAAAAIGLMFLGTSRVAIPTGPGISSLLPAAFRSAISQSIILLDVRTEDEFRSGHIDGASEIDFYQSDFKEKLAALDKTKSYLIYCHSGNRSGKTLGMMSELGFRDVHDLEGGIAAWEAVGYQIVSGV